MCGQERMQRAGQNAGLACNREYAYGNPAIDIRHTRSNNRNKRQSPCAERVSEIIDTQLSTLKLTEACEVLVLPARRRPLFAGCLRLCAGEEALHHPTTGVPSPAGRKRMAAAAEASSDATAGDAAAMGRTRNNAAAAAADCLSPQIRGWEDIRQPWCHKLAACDLSRTNWKESHDARERGRLPSS
jgi:hypothetical protein